LYGKHKYKLPEDTGFLGCNISRIAAVLGAKINKTGNAHNVTLRRIRVTIVAVEKQYYTF